MFRSFTFLIQGYAIAPQHHHLNSPFFERAVFIILFHLLNYA